MSQSEERTALLQGTLDMLILQTLRFGQQHGHGIAVAIEQATEDVLKIDHGSLYPALHRLVKQGLITAKWGTTDNNRRARYYRLTAAGKRRLSAEMNRWERVTRAVARVMRIVPQS